MEFSSERELCVGNAHKFSQVNKVGKGSRWIGGREFDRSGAGEEGMLYYVQDVRTVSWMG